MMRGSHASHGGNYPKSPRTTITLQSGEYKIFLRVQSMQYHP